MDEIGQACFVEYVYGINQALSVAMQTFSKPFDPFILDLPNVSSLVGSAMHVLVSSQTNVARLYQSW